MRYPLAIHTLYAELLQQLGDQRELPGAVYAQRKDGQQYLYVRRVVGATRRDEYLGVPSDPAAVARVAAIRREQTLSRQRRKLVAALKRSGLPAPHALLGRVLDAVSQAGLFSHGVLVGTAAYQCYAGLLGASLPSAALMTQDADFVTAELATKANDGRSTLLEVLRRADPSFEAIPGLKRGALPASFRNEQGFRFDVLTPILRRSDSNPMPLLSLGAGAVPLQYLRWLLADPVPAAVLAGAGVLVRVPQPARFAVHKLIVAQLRRGGERAKRQKDLAQAKGLMTVLSEADPEALALAMRSAKAHGHQGWRQPIERSLAELAVDTPISRANRTS